jgi:hypothetical protein
MEAKEFPLTMYSKIALNFSWTWTPAVLFGFQPHPFGSILNLYRPKGMERHIPAYKLLRIFYMYSKFPEHIISIRSCVDRMSGRSNNNVVCMCEQKLERSVHLNWWYCAYGGCGPTNK